MFVSRRRIREELVHTTSALLARIQRLEAEHAEILLARMRRLEDEQAEMRARLEGERHLRVFTAHIAAAAHVAPAVGAAIERFTEAMRAPLLRGREGGLARSRTAWRYFDGTFMPESEKERAYFEEYERYAAGGRARAAKARRAPDGTFRGEG